MSYQWIKDHSPISRTRIEPLGERRTDKRTEKKIRDALRARSIHAAAKALEHQHVDLATALRVLARPAGRRAFEG